MKTSKILTTTSLIALLSSFGLMACGGSEVEPADQSQQASLAQQQAAKAPGTEAARPEAARNGRDHGPRDHRMGPPSPDKLIERFDANKDGQLQAAELPERMQERIGDIDKNGDAVVTKDELVAHFETMRTEHRAQFEARAKERFEKKDANHDGMLEQSEVDAQHWAHLSVADTNGDQKLTPEELKAAFESGKLRPMRGDHHRFDRGGDAARPDGAAAPAPAAPAAPAQ
ncbi:MAG TPA: hypothetical protein VHB79_39805 [Polyangiaceae bacterium]|nr:hypothetical protein [Polyangiaceae bacterium]